MKHLTGTYFVNLRAVFYWLIAIFVSAIVIASAFYLDDSVREFVRQHQDRALRNFMRYVSRIGDWYGHALLGLVLMAIAWWRGNRKWLRIVVSMLIALAFAGLVARGIKIATARARPSVKAEEIVNRWSSKYHAFPSGHVAASMGFFGVLLFARRRIGVACLPIPILIGISRMYVAAHYLSDVVCAGVLGLLCAYATIRLVRSNGEQPLTKLA